MRVIFVLLVLALGGCAKQKAAPSRLDDRGGERDAEVKAVPTTTTTTMTDASVVSDGGEALPEARPIPPECAEVKLLEKSPCTRWLESSEGAFYRSLARDVDAANISVKVRVDPQPVKMGAPLTVTVTYTNESDRPIALDFRQGAQSKKRGNNLFGYSILDKKGRPADSPSGPDPCCPPGNTSDRCGDVPLDFPSYESMMILRVLLPPHGQAKAAHTWKPTRKRYGPESTFCREIEVGPLLPADYVVEVELPMNPNVKGTVGRSAQAPFVVSAK